MGLLLGDRRKGTGDRGQVFWERDLVLKSLHKIPAPTLPLPAPCTLSSFSCLLSPRSNPIEGPQCQM